MTCNLLLGTFPSSFLKSLFYFYFLFFNRVFFSPAVIGCFPRDLITFKQATNYKSNSRVPAERVIEVVTEQQAIIFSVYVGRTFPRVVCLGHKHAVLYLDPSVTSYGASREAPLRVTKPARETRALIL